MRSVSLGDVSVAANFSSSLASPTGESAAGGAEWIHEIKHDGFRMLLNGRKLVALTANAAAVETLTGGCHTYRRSPVEVGRVVLATIRGLVIRFWLPLLHTLAARAKVKSLSCS
jgi:hypothetical protein